MTKGEILLEIKMALDKEKANKARNSMGNSERFYNRFYLIGACFTTDQLQLMTIQELNNIVALAEFGGEVFY